jgi:hypothetical protein
VEAKSPEMSDSFDPVGLTYSGHCSTLYLCIGNRQSKMNNPVLSSNVAFVRSILAQWGRALAVALLLLFAVATEIDAAASDQPSPSALAPQPQATTCVELIRDGDFEIMGSDWISLAGGYLFTYTGTPVASGRHSLQLGFPTAYNIPGTMGIEQRLTLPTSSDSLELTFQYYTQYRGEISPGDQAILTIYDSSISQPVTTRLLALDTEGTWRMERQALTTLVGREIVLTFAVYGDGEPGQVLLYLDDVSILDCSSGAGQPNTGQPSASQPNAGEPVTPQLVPNSMPNAADSMVPRSMTIRSLSECSCTSALYTCTNFSSWSVAQACYTHCQVTAGFDIHGLDLDRNGIACELELQDITLRTTAPVSASANIAPPSELPTPSVAENLAAITQTLESTAPLSPTDTTLGAELPPTSPVEGVPAQATATVIMSDVLAAVPPPQSAIVPVSPSPTIDAASFTLPAAPASTGTLERLSPLILLGVGIAMGAGILLVGTLVGLWVAHLAGQRRQPTKSPQQ